AGIITASQGLKINVSPAITIRDGTTEKGYIGFNGNDPFIGRKNGVGVAFQNNKIRPVDGDDGSGSNNTVDLGEPTYRFKDGYFAGSLDIEGDIDVNGHTNLDNVSIAGITTISSSGDALTIGAATNASRNLIISADRPANADLGNIIAKNTGGNIAAITFNTGTRSQKDDGVIDFKISPHSGQQLTRAMRLTNGFNLIFGITEAHTSVLGAYSPKIQLESTTVAASSI
ncbi:MAG: hypothetical protein VXY93_16600, partial [Pseudomonadota bacterium]|nr:hypothetical protein [Pseudomonadota bacterium]